MKLRNKKTGEIVETDFELSVSVPDDEKLYGNDTYTQINGYSSIKDLIEDWEDYEEPKEFWFIDPGVPENVASLEFYSEETRKNIKKLGFDFETKEEAEKAVEKLKAWKRLKDKGFNRVFSVEIVDALCGGKTVWFKLLIDDEESIEDIKLLFGVEE